MPTRPVGIFYFAQNTEKAKNGFDSLVEFIFLSSFSEKAHSKGSFKKRTEK